MAKTNKKQYKSKCRINKVKPTEERITGRAGLSLFVRYLEQVQIITNLLIPCFGRLRKNRKGVPVHEVFKQLFCFFIDGTSRHFSNFDQLAKNQAYGGMIGSEPEDLISSHTVKRFFKDFPGLLSGVL